MLTLTIWCCGVALEALLLYRGVRSKLISRYPNFYIYALALFLSDALLYAVYRFKPAAFDRWNWYAGFLVLFLGCGIILEVFRHVLSPYPGADRFARIAATVVFGAIFGFAILYPIWQPAPSAAQALYLVVQRDFLFVQAILLIVLLQVISYYRIATGKNLKGMIFGYGLCVGATLMFLAVRAHVGARFQSTWSWLQQISYFVALAIWVVALWSHHGNPAPNSGIGPDADYDELAARTRDMVSVAGAQLVKVERP
jgi:hypothetical protein